MAKALLYEALRDIQTYAQQFASNEELTLRQSQDFDAKVEIIKEFSLFIAEHSTAMSEQDKFDSLNLISTVYNEIIENGLTCTNPESRSKLSYASNSIFNLNNSISASIQPQQSQTEVGGEQLGGLGVAGEILKYGIDTTAALAAVALNLGVEGVSAANKLATEGVSAVNNLADSFSSLVGMNSYQTWANTADVVAKAINKGVEWVTNNDSVNTNTTQFPDISSYQSQNNIGLEHAENSNELAKPRTSLANHIEKQAELNYLNSASDLNNNLGLIKDLSSADSSKFEGLKARSVESLLSDIDLFEKMTNALSPTSKARLKLMNEMMAKNMEENPIDESTFKEKVSESLRSAFERLKEIISRVLNIGQDKDAGLQIN